MASGRSGTTGSFTVPRCVMARPPGRRIADARPFRLTCASYSWPVTAARGNCSLHPRLRRRIVGQLEIEQLGRISPADRRDGLTWQGGRVHEVKCLLLVAEGVIAAEADPIRAEQLDGELKCPR